VIVGLNVERGCAAEISDFHLHDAQHCVMVVCAAVGRRRAEEVVSGEGILVENIDGAKVCCGSRRMEREGGGEC
jgi:hypothetical protein